MRRRGLGSLLLGVGSWLALVLAVDSPAGDRAWQAIIAFLTREAFYVPHSLPGAVLWRTIDHFVCGLHDQYAAFILLGCVAALGGIVARSVAWARVREGRPDPIERLRSRPRLVRWLRLAPAAAVVLYGVDGIARNVRDIVDILRRGALADVGWPMRGLLAHTLAIAALAAILCVAANAGLRALLAPVTTEKAPPKAPGDIVFSAIAVTVRTRAAVGALAAATVAMVAWTASGPDSPLFAGALAAYVAAAMAAPFLLRRVSRIAVGIDGVWVRDASHAHFFAYRDLDEARPKGADLELVAGGRRVLRLQMHGEDAARRDEVVARVNEGIARSREETNRAAEMVVQSMPARRVASTALGAEQYRTPSISREQLWALVEGPTTDAATRTAAASALTHQLDEGDRARLRVAASRCAEPRMRVTLEGLVSESEFEEEEAAAEPGISRGGRVRGTQPGV